MGNSQNKAESFCVITSLAIWEGIFFTAIADLPQKYFATT